jgi:hypothetical protein
MRRVDVVLLGLIIANNVSMVFKILPVGVKLAVCLPKYLTTQYTYPSTVRPVLCLRKYILGRNASINVSRSRLCKTLHFCANRGLHRSTRMLEILVSAKGSAVYTFLLDGMLPLPHTTPWHEASGWNSTFRMHHPGICIASFPHKSCYPALQRRCVV